MKQAWVIVGLALLLAGCASAPEVVVVTAPSEPATSTPTPTADEGSGDGPELPEETPSATPEKPSATPVPPTPTPDPRVVDASPRSLVLKPDELPQDGRFYLADETPHRNSEILGVFGVEQGQEYLAKSGRIDGWTIVYLRGTRTVLVPEQLWINVVIYKTNDGPRITQVTLGVCDNEEWVQLEIPPGLDYLCAWRETQANGKDYLAYEAGVSYRNLKAQVWAYGYENEFDVSWLLGVANDQLANFETQPLVGVVTYAP